MQILALIIACVIPLLSLYLIYTLDLYKTGEFRAILVSFISGAIAVGTAGLVNRAVLDQHLLTTINIIRYSAPLTEEILKGLLLWYLVRGPKFTYFVEGAVYGFAAGVGFAIFENFQYIMTAGNAGLGTAISRVISTNLMHATTTSLLGIALGYARFERLPRMVLVSLAGLLAAILVHMGFNNLVTRVAAGPLLIYAAGSGLAGAGLIAFIIQRGLKEEKTWIEEKLGMADRVTKGEAAVVNKIENMQELLAPLEQRFGEKKAAQIERFLMTQARLGILRKSLDKLSDERMKRSVEQQMEKLRNEMDDARRKVGSYAMLYLRHTIPENSSPLWGRMEAAIQKNAANRPAGGNAVNLWANLKTRQETKKEPAPESKQENKQ
jgi:RsiW-degrading membrane proteinase PrsW (M82 family)